MVSERERGRERRRKKGWVSGVGGEIEGARERF